MWPMLHAARDRSLADSELTELRRLCEVLAQGLPGREAFTDGAEQLCLSIHSSGIFEGRPVRSVERLLEYVDELRMMLE